MMKKINILKIMFLLMSVLCLTFSGRTAVYAGSGPAQSEAAVLRSETVSEDGNATGLSGGHMADVNEYFRKHPIAVSIAEGIAIVIICIAISRGRRHTDGENGKDDAEEDSKDKDGDRK